MDENNHEDVSSSTNTNDNKMIDKITLELLLNKTHYEKYLNKTDQQKYAEHQTFLANCDKYYHHIMKITSKLLKNPQHPISIDVNQTFDNYVKCIIRDLEIKDIVNKNITETDDNEEYDDVLFPPDMDETPFVKNKRDYRKPPVSSDLNYLSNDFFRVKKKNGGI